MFHSIPSERYAISCIVYSNNSRGFNHSCFERKTTVLEYGTSIFSSSLLGNSTLSTLKAVSSSCWIICWIEGVILRFSLRENNFPLFFSNYQIKNLTTSSSFLHVINSIFSLIVAQLYFITISFFLVRKKIFCSITSLITRCLHSILYF